MVVVSKLTNIIERTLLVLGVVLLSVILIKSLYNELVDNVSPSISQKVKIERTVASNPLISSFTFFPGIGIKNPTTTLGTSSSLGSITDKCVLFGQDCYGFDQIGSLFLKRDLYRSSLSPLKNSNIGFYLKSDGLKSSDKVPVHEKLCQQLDGQIDNVGGSTICRFPHSILARNLRHVNISDLIDPPGNLTQ